MGTVRGCLIPNESEGEEQLGGKKNITVADHLCMNNSSWAVWKIYDLAKRLNEKELLACLNASTANEYGIWRLRNKVRLFYI